MQFSQSVTPMFRAAALTAALALPWHATLGQTPQRVVKNASLQIITGDDGKDDSDVFTVTIANAGGKVLERVFDAREEIKPNTTFNLWLTRVRPEAAEALRNSRITFRIEPKGGEHWVVKEARLTVNYETGPADRWHWGPFVLETKGAPFMLEYTLADAQKL